MERQVRSLQTDMTSIDIYFTSSDVSSDGCVAMFDAYELRGSKKSVGLDPLQTGTDEIT